MFLFRFAHFIHIIAPTDDMFNQMVPDTYWSIKNVDLANEMKAELLKNVPRDYKSRKSSYKNSCKKIKQLVNGKI